MTKQSFVFNACAGMIGTAALALSLSLSRRLKLQHRHTLDGTKTVLYDADEAYRRRYRMERGK